MRLFKFFKALTKKQPKPPNVKAEVIQVSDEIQLTVKGLPPELPPEKRQAISESLVRNTLSRLPQRAYDQGENIYQGQARLRIDDRMYKIVFSLDAIRVLNALTIYKEALDIVNKGAREGIYAPELAELTSDYIKQLAWEEVESVKRAERESLLITQPIDENIEIAIEGLPQSVITPSSREEIVSKLVSENQDSGANFPASILGQIQKTTLKIGAHYYRIQYLFRARKP